MSPANLLSPQLKLKDSTYICPMIRIGSALVSEDLLERQFACDLNACHGKCCVAGDAGAPLTQEETATLQSIYTKVAPFLRPEGREAIAAQGTSIVSQSGDLETPLVNDQECAYVVFDEHQTAFCGIEKAYRAGAVDWMKPLSCHLYPVRALELDELTALNYHHWPICSAACDLGKLQKTPVYQFVKEALVRKFGRNWFAALEAYDQNKIPN